MEDGSVHLRGTELFVATPVCVGVAFGRVPYSTLDGAVEGLLVMKLIVVDDEELVEGDFLLRLVGWTCESLALEPEEEET